MVERKKNYGFSLDNDFVSADAPGPRPLGDYSTPQSSGYNDYPGAYAGARPAYEGPVGGEDSGALGGAAKGAAAGSVGGPWGAIIGAAAGLLTSVMQQKAAAKAAKLKYEQDQQADAQARLAQAQTRQVSTVGEMGNRESNAYQQLLGVLARSVR